jgi:hypothetical protein
VNIFAIEGDLNTGKIDWIASGKSQDNYRVVKMILESCQILSTVLNEQGVDAPYRSFNPKHPSCLWAAESAQNFRDLVTHCASMIDEYEERFGKTHKCKAVLKKIVQLFDASRFPQEESTPLRQAIPEHMKHDNPVIAYRKFYASKPRVRYPKEKIPYWFPVLRGTQKFDIVENK